MDSEDRLSHEQVQRPKLQTSVVDFHQSMTDCDEEAIRDWRRTLMIRAYRFGLLMVDEIGRTELPRRAAALTYTTILSIFPLLAVLTSMVSYFYTPEKESELMGVVERTLLPSTNQVLDRDLALLTETERELLMQQRQFADGIRKMFTDVSDKFRQSAGGVGIFGFIGVLVTAGILYFSIETVVNQTWQTGASRWTDTVRNLILVLLFAPIVVGLSMTASTMAATLFGQDYAPANGNGSRPAAMVAPADSSTEAKSTTTDGRADGSEAAAVESLADETSGGTTGEQSAYEEASAARAIPPEAAPSSGFLYHIRKVTTRFGFMIKVLPLVINTLILTMAYSFLPNTRVKFFAAFAGGFIAAGLWELARYLFFFYVYMSAVNRTLADALGLSVVFLIWVYITWMILLIGNLIAYLTHNYGSLWAERRSGGEMMLDGRLLVATVLLIARRFKYHAPGYTETEIRQRLALRKQEFDMIITRLMRTGYVVRLESGAFHLAQPPEDIRVREVLALGCNLSKLPIVNRISPVATTLMKLQEETLDAAGDRRISELLA